MTWPKKRHWQRQWQRQRQRQWQRQIHLENTFKERSQRLVTFETFDQVDEERWSDQKKTMTKTNTKTKTKTFREHLQRAIAETCDLCNILSEWWGDMTWPKKDNDKDKYQKKTITKTNTKTMTETNTFKNTFKERPWRLTTFQTFDQSDEGTFPDQKMTMTKTKAIQRQIHLKVTFKEQSLWRLRHWLHFWQLRNWIHDDLF